MPNLATVCLRTPSVPGTNFHNPSKGFERNICPGFNCLGGHFAAVLSATWASPISPGDYRRGSGAGRKGTLAPSVPPWLRPANMLTKILVIPLALPSPFRRRRGFEEPQRKLATIPKSNLKGNLYNLCWIVKGHF